jgi:hypothetical protein
MIQSLHNAQRCPPITKGVLRLCHSLVGLPIFQQFGRLADDVLVGCPGEPAASLQHFGPRSENNQHGMALHWLQIKG